MKVFQSFRLDASNHCLWHADERVSLPPKAFDVLRYLVEHPGRLVTQDEILEALWPETYVNPEVVKKYILGIRKVLGDRADEPEFIETLPRRGYQFVAQVSDESRTPTSDSGADTTRIVGRTAAMAALDGCLSNMLRGQRQVIFVTGEAGIGKTTLVDVFHQQAARRPNLRIARGQCVEGFGGKEAYYPMLEALGQLVRDSDGGPFAQVLAKRAPTWWIQFPSLVKADKREALQREIVGATRERMVREICEALETITAEYPLVLIFEDLHWVDPSTLDLISALARRREPVKLMLLGTYRPTDVALSQMLLKGLKQDLQVHRLCEEIAVERLEEPEIAEYLATEFPNSSLPSGLPKLIYQHSGGNALFMVAIVKDMVKKGLIVQEQGGWRLVKRLAEVDPGVPDTLQQMLDVQFDQLSEPEQRILKSASVAGERFSLWNITTNADVEPDGIEELCDRLAERQQFIRSAGIQELSNQSVSPQYEFRHSLYRRAIYRRLSDGIRKRLHLSLAQRLKALCSTAKQEQELASELALHFEGGRDYEQAIRYLMLAAENAARRFAYRDSIQVLQQALELVPKVASSVGAELEVQILELIGHTHYALGAMGESANAYEAAASRAAQGGLKAARVDALTCLMQPFGLIDPDRGISALGEAVELSKTLGDPLLLARTEMLAASCRLLYQTWRKEDADLCASARRTLDALVDSSTPPYHKVMYAYVQALRGNCQEALEIVEPFIPKADETTSLMAHHAALGGKTVALLRLGRFGEVLKIVRTAKEMAEKNGNDSWLLNFREAWLRTLAFDFEGVLQLCEFVMRTNAEYPTGQPRTIARVAAGYAELDRGNYDQAIDYFRQVRDPEITPKFFLHCFWRMTAQLGLSKVWLESGNITNARLEADSFLESALSTDDPHLQALAWEMKTRVAIAEGDWNGARQDILAALAIVEKCEVPVAAWQVHATAWDLDRQVKHDEAGETHRACAEAYILTIANSFEQDVPLRHSFLDAGPVRRVLESVPLFDQARPGTHNLGRA